MPEKPTLPQDKLSAAFSQNAPNLATRFDAVVMLATSGSNWKTEPRSNRYHYASRFARHLPVIFVQRAEKLTEFSFEPTEITGLSLLHLPDDSEEQESDFVRQLSAALQARRVLRPLFWIYDFAVPNFLGTAFSELSIFHATEDYTLTDLTVMDASGRELLQETLAECDGLVAVSEIVQGNYERFVKTALPTFLSTNGCDFGFFTKGLSSATGNPGGRRRAIYQGGINRRVDFDLLHELATMLKDWEFRFLGAVGFLASEADLLKKWERLKALPNVRWLGEVGVEVVRDEMIDATVGLIPFRNLSYIPLSFPLKAYEYVACGLPVVTVPIVALQKNPILFRTANSAREFAVAIEEVAASRHDPKMLDIRRAEAKSQDYDSKFESVVGFIEATKRRTEGKESANVLVLFDAGSVHIKTIQDHLGSFAQFSQHDVRYAPATGNEICTYNLADFDAVVLHYCIRVSVKQHLSPSYELALNRYAGLKMLFIQDEYDYTELSRQYIEDLGILVVYTCVPPKQIDRVYPRSRFPRVEFVPTLTGYVPYNFDPQRPFRPLKERPFLIGYRGRALGYWYGDLGQEKQTIGQTMKAACDQRALTTDIEWDDSKRIYGPGWYTFLESSRATLGTESGSNLFDFDGTLKLQIEDELKKNPLFSYAEAKEKYFKHLEGEIVMNQISPKIFEAIIHRTALILFEGDYSGVVRPHEHYFPLRKDFSNVDEVLAKLQDDACVQAMIERAYADVIISGKYTYLAMIQEFDAKLSQYGIGARPRLALPPSSWYLVPGEKSYQCSMVKADNFSAAGNVGFPLPPTKGFMERFWKTLRAPIRSAVKVWRRLPEPAKTVLRPPLKLARSAYRRLKSLSSTNE